MPSFSVTLTRCFPGQEPMDVLALQDWRPVNKRELHLDLHPRDSDPSVETVNAQFAGSIGYGAEYLVRPLLKTPGTWVNMEIASKGHEPPCT